MDTSKKYIKMCERAKEIQTLYFKTKYRERKETNKKLWYEYCSSTDYIITDKFPFKNDKHYDCLWLPRQDQLQEMVGYMGMQIVMKKAYKMFGSLEISNPKLSDISMEQLWLAFVMKEKYNKVWNGEKWEIINV